MASTLPRPAAYVDPAHQPAPPVETNRALGLAGSVPARHHRAMTSGALLVARLHIDLVRVSSAVCSADF